MDENRLASRKRSSVRSIPDEDDFMPLEKRIACLDLNSTLPTTKNVNLDAQKRSTKDIQSQSQDCTVKKLNDEPIIPPDQYENEGLLDSDLATGGVLNTENIDAPGSPCGGAVTAAADFDDEGENSETSDDYCDIELPALGIGLTNYFRYEPSLNQNSNPFYYEQNRRLFDLYLERLRRQDIAPHPDLLRLRQQMFERFGN